MIRALAPLLLLVTSCTYANAQACRSELFPTDVTSVSSAQVNVQKTSVLDGDACTTLSESCKSKAYLLQNDTVLRTPLTRDGYSCIAFFNGKRQTTGWVKSESLTPSTVPATQGDWSGHWKRLIGGSDITIRRSKDGSYSADALATYAVTSDNVRTGTAQGKLTISEASGMRIASFGDAGVDRTTVCRVQIREYGAWLLADDGATEDSNSACGGMGVTLSGIYQRQTNAVRR